MKIVYNNLIPFKGFLAINLFGVLFVRKKYKDILENPDFKMNVLLNHEKIHTEQMKELVYIPYYIIYCIEWIFRFLGCFSCKDAYKYLSFEQEAYRNEQNLDYIKYRQHFAQWRKYN